MIGCVSPMSGGTLRILGQDPDRDGPRIRRALASSRQDTLDNELTVRENLLIYGRYFGLSRAECAKRRTISSTSPSSPSAPATRSSTCRAG